ncbi:MAG: hypothetical protein ACQEVD_02325 [Actinomycetota bacterium]
MHEIVGMMIVAGRSGDETSGLRDAAIGNGVTEDQLRDARVILSALPDTSDKGLVEFTHSVYVADGLDRGYVRPGEEEKHSPPAIGMLAHEYYGH